jgi:hypothetical protein
MAGFQFTMVLAGLLLEIKGNCGEANALIHREAFL